MAIFPNNVRWLRSILEKHFITKNSALANVVKSVLLEIIRLKSHKGRSRHCKFIKLCEEFLDLLFSFLHFVKVLTSNMVATFAKCQNQIAIVEAKHDISNGALASTFLGVKPLLLFIFVAPRALASTFRLIPNPSDVFVKVSGDFLDHMLFKS